MRGEVRRGEEKRSKERQSEEEREGRREDTVQKRGEVRKVIRTHR